VFCLFPLATLYTEVKVGVAFMNIISEVEALLHTTTQTKSLLLLLFVFRCIFFGDVAGV